MAAVVGILPLLPEISRAAGIDTIPIVMSLLTVTAAITRVLAIPEVDAWVDRYIPWLSADPINDMEDDGYTGKHRARDH